MKRWNVVLFPQSMSLSSDEAVGARTDIRGEGPCWTFDRTRRQRGHYHLF